MIYNMKKLFFVIITLMSFALSAQTEKEVPISIELKDALFKIQKTFSFIGFHSTILEIYDLNRSLIKRRIKSGNYIIETFDNVSFYMNRGKFTHYYLIIILVFLRISYLVISLVM